jgi:hypothetical protein
MIEKILLDYLKTALSPTTVTMEIRQGMPDSFVFIEKTGSSQSDRLFNATFAIQSYAGSLYDAMVLNEAVKNAMFEAVELKQITRVELNSDYNYTDTTTKKPRYQAVFDLTHYKE